MYELCCDSEKLLSCALDIGEQMVICGAEIERVEDSIIRICKAYNVRRIDVFTISSNINASLEDESGKRYAQTRRIKKHFINLDKLHELNSLSRKICSQKPELSDALAEFESIKSQKPYHMTVQCLSCAIIASSFAVFFGGNLLDAAVAAIIGIILKLVIKCTEKTNMNMIVANTICSFLACSLALLSGKAGLGLQPQDIIIGNIMILIPGVELTNSIRDMISGDIMSGLLCFFEACLIALGIAAGYVVAAFVFGGAV